MSRLIVSYCLMIAGALSNSIASSTQYEIHISGLSLHPQYYDEPNNHQVPSVQVARLVRTRNHEASWQHQVLTGYSKDNFAQWATHKNISADDLFGQHHLSMRTL